MHHKIRTQNDSSWECQAGTAAKVSKAKLNTSAKEVEKSSEKICSHQTQKWEQYKQAIATTQCSKKKIEYIINIACKRYIENAMKHRFHS